VAEKPTPGTLLQLSPEALFRHQVVSAVRAKCLGGVPLAAAVSEVAAQPQLTLQGTLRSVSARSIRRWLDDHATAGLAGLETARPAPRPISAVLPAALLDFLRTEKGQDRYASVPELLRRAVALWQTDLKVVEIDAPAAAEPSTGVPAHSGGALPWPNCSHSRKSI